MLSLFFLIVFWLFFNRVASIFFGLVIIFILYFSRDPERVADNSNDKAVLSPADGKIIQIAEVEDVISKNKQIKVSIFLSLFDVHVIRAPIEGNIEYLMHNKGSALNSKASMEKDNIILNIRNEKILLVLRIIAGTVAKKVICYKNLADTVSKGERVGRILLGSRTEIFVPRDKIDCIRVKEGEKVRAAQTILLCLS
jgi:phosphatidylserine decarboxylase